MRADGRLDNSSQFQIYSLLVLTPLLQRGVRGEFCSIADKTPPYPYPWKAKAEPESINPFQPRASSLHLKVHSAQG